MSKPQPKYFCAVCDREFDHVDVQLAPMLKDEAWARFGRPRDTLCAECFFARAIERDIDLTLRDLLPCPFNLPGWFELFAGTEASAEDLAAWRAAANKLLELREGRWVKVNGGRS